MKNDNPVIKKRLISNDGKYANLIVVPLNNEIYVPLSDQLHEITNMDKYKKYKFHFGGQAYVTGAVPQMVSEEVKILLGYGVLLMSLILFFNIRNIKAVFLILLTILLSLGGMMGFMAWIHHFTGSNDFYFTMMNTSMPIVLLTIANSDGVHVLSRFFKELRRLKKKEEAIISTMKNLALPIFLTSITTSMAFLMLIFSPVGAMLGYGVTLAFGIMWAWILSNTFLVSCIKLFNWDINSKAISKPNYIETLMKKFGKIVTKKPKKVLLTGSILVLLSIIGIFFIKVEVQYTEMFKKGNIIRDSAEFLDDKMMGNVNLIIRATISDSTNNTFTDPAILEEIEVIQNYLDDFENVTSTISFIDIVKQTNKYHFNNNHNYYIIPKTETYNDENKNGKFDKAELFYEGENSNNDNKYDESDDCICINHISIPENCSECYLDCGRDGECPSKWNDNTPDQDGSEGNRKFDAGEDFKDLDNDITWTDGKARIVSSVASYIPEDQISPVINSSRDTIIITALMKTFSTSKVEGYENQINKFIDSNSSGNIDYDLTGMMIFIVDFMWLVIESSAWGIIYSIGIIFLLATLFFKSWRYGILSTIPLAAAVFLNFGLMGWFGIELTHLTALLSSIIIGVGVDFSIHYIAEYRKIKQKIMIGTSNLNPEDLSTETINNVGYPIVLDAWSNMGFGALLLSSIIPLGQIGGLMVFAMIATSVGALTLLASALEIFRSKIK